MMAIFTPLEDGWGISVDGNVAIIAQNTGSKIRFPFAKPFVSDENATAAQHAERFWLEYREEL